MNRMTRKLVLEERQDIPDGAGGYRLGWTGLGTLWAEVQLRSGRDTRVGPTSVSSSSYKIKVRAAPMGSPSRPRADMRFREGERLFRIQAVSEADATGRSLICFAEEEAAT